jgi:hypothetical protein
LQTTGLEVRNCWGGDVRRERNTYIQVKVSGDGQRQKKKKFRRGIPAYTGPFWALVTTQIGDKAEKVIVFVWLTESRSP